MKPAREQTLPWRRPWRLAACLALGAWWLAGCGPKPAAPAKKAAPPPAAKATNVVALDTNRFRGRFTDGLSTIGRDPFFPLSERGRPSTGSTNGIPEPRSVPWHPTNWVVTAIVVSGERRDAKVNNQWIREGTTKPLRYAGGTALVECVKVLPTKVALQVERKPVEKKLGRGANR